MEGTGAVHAAHGNSIRSTAVGNDAAVSLMREAIRGPCLTHSLHCSREWVAVLDTAASVLARCLRPPAAPATQQQ